MSSLSLWLYFLDLWEQDANSASSTVNPLPPPGPRSNAGSGGRHYDRLPLDFWMVREEYMRGVQPTPKSDWLIPKGPVQRIAMPDTSPPRFPPPPPVKRELTQEERGSFLSAMKGASSLSELKRLSRKLSA